MEPVIAEYRTPARLADDWQITATGGTRSPRVVRSLHLQPYELEAHNVHLQEKYARIAADETRYALEEMDDADICIVAYGTSARVARTVCQRARAEGIKAGIFRPITLWPFPASALAQAAKKVRAMVVLELSAGQMIEDVRLAVEGSRPIYFHGRTGGMIPTPAEVLETIHLAASETEPDYWVPVETGARPKSDEASELRPFELYE
jgi:2-oxoglutarate ferredoxin oxidoreductase subunit alpha